MKGRNKGDARGALDIISIRKSHKQAERQNETAKQGHRNMLTKCINCNKKYRHKSSKKNIKRPSPNMKRERNTKDEQSKAAKSTKTKAQRQNTDETRGDRIDKNLQNTTTCKSEHYCSRNE